MNSPSTISSHQQSTTDKEKEQKVFDPEIFRWVLLGTATLAAIGGVVFVVRRIAQKGVSNNSFSEALFSRKSTTDPQSGIVLNPAQMALMLNEYLSGLWVEEEGVFQILAGIPYHQFMEEIDKEYQKQYRRPLAEHLQDRLNDAEMRVVRAILDYKPQNKGGSPPILLNETPRSIALRMDEAFGFWGTDEYILFEEIAKLPSQSWYWDVVDAYRQEYGENLDEKLKDRSHLYADQLEVLTTLYHSKPK